MDERRGAVMRVLEQLVRTVRDLSDEDFDKLMAGELEASVSVGEAAAKAAKGRKADLPVADAAFGEVQARLAAAESREEGQRIVEEALAGKEQLFAFAKWLDLPVQRNDAAKRIREKVVTHTVGRRLSGKAVRGDGGANAGGAIAGGDGS